MNKKALKALLMTKAPEELELWVSALECWRYSYAIDGGCCPYVYIFDDLLHRAIIRERECPIATEWDCMSDGKKKTFRKMHNIPEYYDDNATCAEWRDYCFDRCNDLRIKILECVCER